MPLEDTIISYVKRSANGVATWWPTKWRCANKTPLTDWLTVCLPPWSITQLHRLISPHFVKKVPKVSYRVDTIPSLVCSVPDEPSPRCRSLRSLLILPCNLNLSLPSYLFRSRLRPEFCQNFPQMHATCCIHIFLLDLIIRMLFVMKCKLCTSSWSTFFRPSLISYL
jgi:hypothetical protein